MIALIQKTALLGILIALLIGNSTFAEDDLAAALKILQAAKSGSTSQTEPQNAWKIVAKADTTRLPEILSAMRDTGPIAENWLRAAVDTIVERKLRESGKLPTGALEEFVLNNEHAPRARRTAFEWLAEVDSTARARLLPQMLDDSSLELRYDAVADLLTEAAATINNEVKLKIYRRAFAAARALDQMTECIDQLEKLGDSPDLEKHFAFVTRWLVIGPFDNTGGEGMDNIYPPEKEIDFSKEYEGKSGKVTWREYQTEANDLKNVGRVDLNVVVNEEKEVVAYAAAIVISEVDQKVQCRYETVNASELWVNGKQLASANIYHSGGEFDQNVIPIELHRGENTILLKICQNEIVATWTRPWNFRLRLTDQLGTGIAHDYGPEN